jgi:hypothetical protein
MSTNRHRIVSIFIPAFLIAAILVQGIDAFSPPQTTFIQSPPNRNQSQSQQGLPQDKKKSLSNYGPEDVFPSETEQESRKRTRGRSATRPSPSVSPSATLQPAATPSISPAATPIKTAGVTTGSSPDDAAAAVALTQQKTQQIAPGQKPSIDMVIPGLALVSLLVLTALIYVVLKLMEKLREGSN